MSWTSRPAPGEVSCGQNLHERVGVDETAREVFTRRAPRLIARSSERPMRPWVLSLRTRWIDTQSLPAIDPFGDAARVTAAAAARSLVRWGFHAWTSMPNARAIVATRDPSVSRRYLVAAVRLDVLVSHAGDRSGTPLSSAIPARTRANQSAPVGRRYVALCDRDATKLQVRDT